jgi:hypothetical protein
MTAHMCNTQGHVFKERWALHGYLREVKTLWSGVFGI